MPREPWLVCLTLIFFTMQQATVKNGAVEAAFLNQEQLQNLTRVASVLGKGVGKLVSDIKQNIKQLARCCEDLCVEKGEGLGGLYYLLAYRNTQKQSKFKCMLKFVITKFPKQLLINENNEQDIILIHL